MRGIRLVEDRWTTVRHIVEAFAIVAAGLWAFYTFVYQEKIKPAGEPASLSASMTFRHLGHDARREILGVDIRFQNTGKTEIDIAAEAYDVWGERYGTRETVVEDRQANRRLYTRVLPTISRHLIVSFAHLRDAAVGGEKNIHIILGPGTTETIAEVITFRRGEYDLIHGQVFAVPVKTSDKQKVNVAVVKIDAGGVAVVPRNPDYFEDDNVADIALIP